MPDPMRSEAARSRQPLQWRAPHLLEDSPPAGCSVELDAYDWWHFRRLGAHDSALEARLRERPELVATAFDLYGILYKPRYRWKVQLKNPLSQALERLLERRGELAQLRRATELHELHTVMALGPLLEGLEAGVTTGQEAARNAEHASADDERDGEGNGDGASGPAGDGRPGPFATLSQLAVGAALAFGTRKLGGRVVHGKLDAYEEARSALEQYDREHGLTELPDVRGNGRGPVRRRFGQRRLPPEPPWRRRGVPKPLRGERDALVRELRARLDELEAAKRCLGETEEAAMAQIATGEDPRSNRACADAALAVDETRALLEQLASLYRESHRWGRELGAGHSLPMEQLLRIARLIRSDASIRALLEAVGRWTITLKRSVPRGKSRHGKQEAVGAELGGELPRLLPSELVHLGHPTLRRHLLARVLERRAMVTQLAGPHLLGRGPVIVVVDTSGSMGGARITMAKALCLALALRCQQKRRPFHVITFGSRCEIHETTFEKSADFDERLRGCIELAFGGGTDFDAPIERVCELATAKPWSHADALFITDGECIVANATVERLAAVKRATDLQVIGVLVASGRGLDAITDATYGIDPDSAIDPEASADNRRLLERLAGRL